MTNTGDDFSRRAAAVSMYCRHCSSPLVQASGWAKQDEDHWEVRLWCPECWHDQIAVLNKTQAAHLSMAVEEGFACILDELEGFDAIPVVEPGNRPRLA
jgi:hypothetical protein